MIPLRILVHTVVSQPFSENSYIFWREGSNQALVVDPGFEPEAILDSLAERELVVAAILNTHGHVDHIAGNRAMKEAFPDAPILIGEGDAIMLIDPEHNLSAGHGIPITSPPADRKLQDSEQLNYADIPMECWDIPGHSPGHIVFAIRNITPTIVFGGDVLFRGSVGRTDFPGGSFEQLEAGIKAKLWVLPADTVVYPGHGPTTTVGHEMRTNPYVGRGA